MINYYEVLEVSQKASDEIIEKAYKVLAKKYHPDLQQGDNKKVAEEKMKLVNEAYDVLSNHEKRENYNKKLNEQRQRENIKKQVQTNINNNYAKQDINNYKTNYSSENTKQSDYNRQTYDREELKKQQKFRENLEKEARRRYLDAYDNYLRSLGYKVRYRWTWERVKALLITILVFAISLGVLWMIPPSREYMIKLYEENFVIKIIVDIIGSLINSFISIFKK